MKPAIKHVENCEQTSLWVCCATLNFGFKPFTRPYSFSSFEKCNRESLFGIEIAVKTGFSAT